MRGRVGCFTAPVIGSGGGSVRCPFWQRTGLGFGHSGAISVWALHGWQNLWKSLRAEWSQPRHPHCSHRVESALLEMALLMLKATLQSWRLWAAATCHGFGRLNENAPWCSEVLIWIFIKLQLCIFYLSLIHLASWDITVLHSNYRENICVLMLWGLVSLSRI